MRRLADKSRKQYKVIKHWRMMAIRCSNSFLRNVYRACFRLAILRWKLVLVADYMMVTYLYEQWCVMITIHSNAGQVVASLWILTTSGLHILQLSHLSEHLWGC